MVEIEIDGKTLQVAEGSTVIEAAHKLGKLIHDAVPTFIMPLPIGRTPGLPLAAPSVRMTRCTITGSVGSVATVTRAARRSPARLRGSPA